MISCFVLGSYGGNSSFIFSFFFMQVTLCYRAFRAVWVGKVQIFSKIVGSVVVTISMFGFKSVLRELDV